MTKNEKAEILTKNPIGIDSVYGRNIMLIDIQYGIEDYMIFIADGKLHKAKIYYSNEHTYFYYKGRRCKTSDFMRV